MNTQFIGGGLSVVLALIQLAVSAYTGIGLAFSSGGVLGGWFVWSLVAVVSAIDVVVVTYGIKGIARKVHLWQLFFVTIPVTLAASALVAIPLFDQLGWFGF